jgi:CRP-like cAMP-binding protein/ribonuclease BN (tRNA processing enzyme)
LCERLAYSAVVATATPVLRSSRLLLRRMERLDSLDSIFTLILDLVEYFLVMEIRVLGCSGGSTPEHHPTSFLIDGRLLLDAGSAGSVLTEQEQVEVKEVLFTHLHLDHIAGLAFIYANTRKNREGPIAVYGPGEIIQGLKEHLFNRNIIPGGYYEGKDELSDFRFYEIEHEKPFSIGPYEVEAVKVNHYGGGTGYIITRDKESFVFTGDTGITEQIWKRIKERGGVDLIITETSFPDHLEMVAEASQHLTPAMLAAELDKLKPGSTPVYISHLKPGYIELLLQEIAGITRYNLFVLKEGDVLKTSEVRESEGKGHLLEGEEPLVDKVPLFDFSKDLYEQREDMEREFGESFAAGQMIFEEREPGTTMYIIQEGRVQVFRRILGAEKILSMLGPGDIFGEMAMLNQLPRSASVRAITDTRVLAFNRAAFEKLVKENYGVALKLIRTLAQRIEEVDVHIENLMFSDNESKVINTLIRAARDEGIPVARGYHVKLTPEDLAIRTGLHLDILKEVLAGFIKSHLVHLRRNTLVIPDLRKLERLLAYLELKQEFREI